MLETCVSEGTTRLVFEGSLDTDWCDENDGEVLEAVEQSDGPLEFDLEQVDFVSSSFLRLCLRASNRLGPGQFHVVNVEPMIRRVFKIAGLDMMLTDA
ncbi:MAG TPA: hypothetical protein DD670_07155 [Planctomycetaceae bacterium]|nr:hypothetical protein [Planctomycetaceae bacterium]